MSQQEVDALFAQRSMALALHELDLVFGKGNILTQKLMATGSIPATMLMRALLRQQYHNIKRMERIEAKLGMKWDPKSLDAKPEGQ